MSKALSVCHSDVKQFFREDDRHQFELRRHWSAVLFFLSILMLSILYQVANAQAHIVPILTAGAACSKSDFENALAGRNVISKIAIGGKGVQSGTISYFTHPDYLDTLLHPGGHPEYLLEGKYWPVSAMNQVPAGTSFEIVKVEIDGDALELKLKPPSGHTENVRLVEGKGWAKLDCNSSYILSQLLQFFTLQQQVPKPDHTITMTNAQQGSGPAVIKQTSEYQQDLSAPAVPGRISNAQLQSILTDLDQQDAQTLKAILMQTYPLAATMRTFYARAKSMGVLPNHPIMQAIATLQLRLGKSLEPRTTDDVLQMTSVMNRASRIFYQIIPSDTMNLDEVLDNVCAARDETLKHVKLERDIIIGIERDLDRNDLKSAYAGFQSLGPMSEIAPVQTYISATDVLRSDLAHYMEASQNIATDISSLLSITTLVVHDSQLLKESQSFPITVAMLQKNLATNASILKARIAELPPVQISERDYALPDNLKTINAADARERLTAIRLRISQLDSKIGPISQVTMITSKGEIMMVLGQVLDAASLEMLEARRKEFEEAAGFREKLQAEEARTNSVVSAQDAVLQAKAEAAERQAFRQENCRPTGQTLCMNGFTTGMTEGDAVENAAGLGYQLRSCKSDSTSYYKSSIRDCKYFGKSGWSLRLAFGRRHTLLSAVEGTESREKFYRYFQLLEKESGEPTVTIGDTREWQLYLQKEGANIAIIASCNEQNGTQYCSSVLMDGIAMSDETKLDAIENTLRMQTEHPKIP